MKIVTYVAHPDYDTVRAMTHEEFEAAKAAPEWKSEGFAWDEWVWQDQPNKEDAIRRHDTAFEAWRDDCENSRPFKDTY